MAFFDIDIPTAIKLCSMADLSIVALLWLYRYEGGSKRALSFFVSGQFLRALGMSLISFRAASNNGWHWPEPWSLVTVHQPPVDSQI